VGGDGFQMSTAAPSGRPRSLLRYEWDLFRAQVRELRDQIINFIFALSFGRAEWRGRTVTLLFLILVGLVALRAHRLPEWADHFRNIFIYLLNPVVRPTFVTNPITDTLRFALDGWPTLLRYLPVFVLPYLMAMQYAARFLADIFEKPIDLARKFVWEVALGGTSETAVIREGEFANRDDSLIYAIGGPGYVVVEMDSAALFEKPDGTPRVIGPTVNGPVPLTGFERFRQALDLRDQHIRLDDGQEISGRTLDGIIVGASDVQVRFSIDRGGKEKTLRTPFPFKSQQVVEKLIYEEPRTVTEESVELAAGHPYRGRSQILSITKILHAEFKRFIGKHKLTEFLASYGETEFRKLTEQKAAIERQRQSVLPEAATPDQPADKEDRLPKFTARPEITERFRDKFDHLYRAMGLELVWIDIGTWKTPQAIVPELHLEAWKVSSENVEKGTDLHFQRVERTALVNKAIQMIRNMPIERHHKISRQQSIKHRDMVKHIVSGYREQLAEARDFLERELLKKEGNTTRVIRDLEEISDAIKHIDQVTDMWKHSPRPFDWEQPAGEG
jgi:hypothetical protein